MERIRRTYPKAQSFPYPLGTEHRYAAIGSAKGCEMKKVRYFSVDVESSGPIPGKYSMLSLGACVVDRRDEAFYVELKPISPEFVPDALKVAGLDLDQLRRTGKEPAEAMIAFRKWVETA